MAKLSCDFDNTLYDTPENEPHVGPLKGQPTEGAMEALQTFLDDGHEVRILTARPDHPRIREWLKQYGIDIEVSSTKKSMDLMIDNNGLRYNGDWGETLDEALDLLEEEHLS